MRNLKSKKKVIIVPTIVGIVGLLIVNDLYGFGGQIKFYSKWAECGQKPVRAQGSGLWNATKSYYSESPDFSMFRPVLEYYCTPRDAELAGFSSNDQTYDFPHLTAQEKSDVMKRKFNSD